MLFKSHYFAVLQFPNFQQFYLCYVGANWLIRKMAGASSPDLDITQDGNKFHIKLHSLVQTKETEFSVDQEFEETQQNGVVMKVLDLYTVLHKHILACFLYYKQVFCRCCHLFQGK